MAVPAMKGLIPYLVIYLCGTKLAAWKMVGRILQEYMMMRKIFLIR